jgi:hypothetical protein
MDRRAAPWLNVGLFDGGEKLGLHPLVSNRATTPSQAGNCSRRTLCTAFSLPWALGVWVTGTAADAISSEATCFSLVDPCDDIFAVAQEEERPG